MKTLIIIILIIVIVIYISTHLKLIEGYNKWEWKLFNQNWNKPWKDPAVAYNNPYPQEIPRSSNNDENFPTYILEIVKEGYIDKVLNIMLNKKALKFKKDLKKVNLHWDNYYKINKYTWHNYMDDFNLYNDFNYEDNQQEFKPIKSCIPQVNKVLKYFINNFNKIFSSACHEKFVRDYYGYSPFSIYKYRIHNIKQARMKDKSCVVDYGIFVVLIRDESYVGITLYLDFIVEHDKINLVYFDLVGYYSTDKLFLPKGDNEILKGKYNKTDQQNYYYINPLYRDRKGEVNYYNVNKILWKQKNYNYDNTLQDQYTCFNTEPQYYNPSGIPPTTPESTSQPILKYVYNKYNCEAKYDQYGRRKPKGLWDRPCLNDSECIFYGKNKNYKNNFGQCNKDYGFCEVPRGMKNLGFHYYYPFDIKKTYKNEDNPICNPHQGNPAPLCYNCKSVNKSGKWKPITPLGNCCEDQRNKELYPYLDGSDYAFKGDTSERINNYNMQNFLKKKST